MGPLFPAFVLALLALALPAGAAPIVFDFEDGLEGWELHGSAQRLQTQLLGGEWAIFGDGSVEGAAFIQIYMDLTDIAFISVEQFFVDGDEDALTLRLLNCPGGFNGPICMYSDRTFRAVGPGNPNRRSLNLKWITGPTRLDISWIDVDVRVPPWPFPTPRPPLVFPSHVAFIDNITFHRVPEPATLVLLALGMVGVAGLRRLRREG